MKIERRMTVMFRSEVLLNVDVYTDKRYQVTAWENAPDSNKH